MTPAGSNQRPSDL